MLNAAFATDQGIEPQPFLRCQVFADLHSFQSWHKSAEWNGLPTNKEHQTF
jgi:hypothetical protein